MCILSACAADMSLIGMTAESQRLTVPMVRCRISTVDCRISTVRCRISYVWCTKSDSHGMKSDSHTLESDSHTLESDSHTSYSDSHTLESDSHGMKYTICTKSDSHTSSVPGSQFVNELTTPSVPFHPQFPYQREPKYNQHIFDVAYYWPTPPSKRYRSPLTRGRQRS